MEEAVAEEKVVAVEEKGAAVEAMEVRFLKSY